MTPSYYEVETAIQDLELEDRQAIRNFYNRERRLEAKRRKWRLVGQVIKWGLIVTGLAAVGYVLAVLWLLL